MPRPATRARPETSQWSRTRRRRAPAAGPGPRGAANSGGASQLHHHTRQKRKPDSRAGDAHQQTGAGADVGAPGVPVEQHERGEAACHASEKTDLERPEQVLPGGPEQHQGRRGRARHHRVDLPAQQNEEEPAAADVEQVRGAADRASSAGGPRCGAKLVHGEGTIEGCPLCGVQDVVPIPRRRSRVDEVPFVVEEGEPTPQDRSATAGADRGGAEDEKAQPLVASPERAGPGASGERSFTMPRGQATCRWG